MQKKLQIANRKVTLIQGTSRSHTSNIVLVRPVESGILGFGIRNTAQGIPNPTNDWNPEFKLH